MVLEEHGAWNRCYCCHHQEMIFFFVFLLFSCLRGKSYPNIRVTQLGHGYPVKSV